MPTGVFGNGEEEVTAMLTTVSWKTTPGAGPASTVWGAIGHNQVLGPVIFQGLGPGRGNGITAQRHMDQVLHPHVLHFFQAHGNWVFQHDNARPHTARATQDLLQRSGIQVMPWPALSPEPY
nr:hypothetical protein BaRGS_027818 [Batillaria attramentaria]